MVEEEREGRREGRYERLEVVRRHSPRLVPFLLSGSLVGLLVGAALALLGPPSRSASLTQETVVLGLPGALLGGLLGGVVFLLLERRRR